MKTRAFVMAAIFIFAALLLSCTKTAEIPQESYDNLKKLGDSLAADLKNDILPNREGPQKLADKGYVVSTKSGAEGLEALSKFGSSHEAHNDCDVTMVFAETAFVVTRVVFSDGEGYYFRYQYDPNNPESYTINCQLISDASLIYQNNPPKWIMTLYNDKKEIATFNFRKKE